MKWPTGEVLWKAFRERLARTRLPAPLISPNHRAAFTALFSFCKSLLPPPVPPLPRLYIRGLRPDSSRATLARRFSSSRPFASLPSFLLSTHALSPTRSLFYPVLCLVRLPPRPAFPLRESYSPRPLPLSLPLRVRVVSVRLRPFIAKFSFATFRPSLSPADCSLSLSPFFPLSVCQRVDRG